MRPVFMHLFLAAVLLTMAAALSSNGVMATERPNIVFILADDLGWSDVSYQGGPIPTPHIDALAASGMQFTSAYAAPMCSPTRGAILSGKFPQRTRFTGITPNHANGRLFRVPNNADVLPGNTRGMLDLEEFTYAQALRDGGYHTGFVGKYHVGGGPDEAHKQGFDQLYHFDPRNSQLRFDDDGRFCTELKADAAITYLEERQQEPERPFLLYVCPNAVHTRIAARKQRIAHFQEQGFPTGRVPWNAEYAAFVSHLDDMVGRIIETVEQSDIRDNTIICFVSDNGGLGPPVSLNTPLRGTKAQLYEGGIRVPWIIRWPGVTEPGSVCRQQVHVCDLYPTFLSMTGLPARPEQHLDGRDITALLRGESQPERPLYWHFPHFSNIGTPGSVIRLGDWKLIRFYSRWREHIDPETHTRTNYLSESAPSVELYHIGNDPGEHTDLSAQEPERVAHMLTLLDAHLEAVDAEMVRPNPWHDPAKTMSKGPQYTKLPARDDR